MTHQQRSILAVAMLTQGVAVGLTVGILPVFLQPLELAFDAPRTQIAAAQILIMLSLTIGSILTGAALDRGYARPLMMAGATLMVTAQLVASIAPNLWVLGLAALMAGFAIPSIGPITAASLVTRVFDEERGRALGLMSMGPPLGSGLFALLAGWAILAFGWRETFLLFAGIAAIVLLPMIWFIVPDRYETQVSGAGGGGGGGEDGEGDAGGEVPEEVTMGDVARMPVFLWSAGVFALAAGISTGWTTHVAAYLTGVGLDESQASTWLAVQYWMGVPGAVFFGIMADRFGLTALFTVMLGLAVACFSGLALVPDPLAAKAICTLFGFSFGGVIPLYMLLLGQRLGPDALGRAMGLSNLFMLPVVFGAVLLAASVFESTGGYTNALLVFAVGMALSIGCLFGSSRSAHSV